MKSICLPRWIPVALVCWLLPAFLNPVYAQGAATMEERVARLEAASHQAPVINSGDNAWVLASAALVLMMTAPGLILFYGGLVRRKNVLGTMMQSLILMAMVSVLWMVYGYSMAFGEGNAVFRKSVAVFHAQRRGGRAQSGLCADDPAGELHAVSNDVRHHHPGADQRRDGGTDEVQGLRPVHGAVGDVHLFPVVPHGLGQGRPV